MLKVMGTGQNEDAKMNFEQKSALVNALLECDIMKNPGKRDTVVNQLKDDIRNTVQGDNHPRVHVLNIVSRCGDFSEGIDELIGIVRMLEGRSEGMKKVDEVMRIISRPASMEELASQEKTKEKRIPFLAPSLPPYELVGREDLMSDIRSRLFTEIPVKIALNGLPGVGKTSIAVTLAYNRDVLKHFKNGVLWAGLGRDANVMSHLFRWGLALGISSDEMKQMNSLTDRKKIIQSAIGTRRMLLIIDDVWQIEDAMTFDVGGPDCACLITTRLPNIATDFANDRIIAVSELNESDSIALLASLSKDVVDRETDEIKRLIEAVGGLPLPLCLMGKYLQKESRSGRPRRLRTALNCLSKVEERLRLSQPKVSLEHHPGLPDDIPLSLMAVIGVSYEALDEVSRQAFRALSLFSPKPNTFSESAALEVSDVTVEKLDTLEDFGLLEFGGPDRYMLHQTIADYANTKLTDTTHTTHNERFIDFFVRFAKTHETDYFALDLEINNLSKAFRMSFDTGMGYYNHDSRLSFKYFKNFIELSEILAKLYVEDERKFEYSLGISEACLYMIHLCWKLKKGKEIFKYIEKSKSRALINLLSTADIKPSDRLAERQSLFEKEKTCLHELRQIQNFKSPGEKDKIYNIFRILDRIYNEIKKIDPEYVFLRRGTHLSYEQINNMLYEKSFIRNERTGIALLEYFVTQEKTYLIVIRPEDEEPNVVEIPEGEDFWKQARDELYLNLATVRPGKPQRFEGRIGGFYKLGTLLIEPALDYLENIDLLYIVPHKDLHYLPFHGMKITKYGIEVHLIEAFQVVYLPSASVLKFCQNKNPYRQDKKNITAPLIFGTWAEDDKEFYKKTIQSELNMLSSLFQVGAIEKLNASKERLIKEAPIADLLHIICHGYFVSSEDVMSSSGLLLNDGKTFPHKPDKKCFLESVSEKSFLSAKEMIDIKLHCHLVTLSAGETGQSENRTGDELIGFPRALLSAGSPSILLALWLVHPEPKMMLMKSFYQHWKSNMQEGKSKALQIAQTEMLKDEQFNSLYHWGAYFLTGDWL